MKYCSNCGNATDDTANFCPICGHRVADAATLVEEDSLKALGAAVLEAEDDILDAEYVKDLDEGYRVVLVSCGTCPVKTAREVIADLVGYTTTTVQQLIKEVPVEIADELTEKQALVLAQALAEYGMEVTVVDENNAYVNLNTQATGSVYEPSGSLTAAALALLGTLTAANRVHRRRRYTKRSLLDILFKPAYAPAPPKHIRRQVARNPEPARRMAVQKKPQSPAPARTVSSRPAAGGAGSAGKPSGTGRPSGGPANLSVKEMASGGSRPSGPSNRGGGNPASPGGRGGAGGPGGGRPSGGRR